jgi:O-acetyl-ADP-ribose deacetylase (regulator of RNase III)
MLWRASEASIRDSVRNAMNIARDEGYASIAFPIIGAGSGGFKEDVALELMREELAAIDYDGEVVLVRFRAPR